MEKHRFFISMWASYLLEITNRQPTSKDYYNYSLTTVDTFPTIAGGSSCCANSTFFSSERPVNFEENSIFASRFSKSKIIFCKFVYNVHSDL